MPAVGVAALACLAACGEANEDGDVQPRDQLANGASAPGLRRLIAPRYRALVREVLGVDASDLPLPTDGAVGPFASNVGAETTPLHVEMYAATAEAIAERVDLSGTAPCARDGVTRDCASEVVGALGARLARRPLSAADREMALAVYDAYVDVVDEESALRATLAALLQSPATVYRAERTVPVDRRRGRLDGDALAARLAFFLWDAPPDDALRTAAESGLLETRAGLRVEAERMLADPRAGTAFGRFVEEWMGLDAVDRLAKDPARYPILDASLREAMAWETAAFADWAFRQADGRLETLLSAPVAFLRGPLFRVYGMEEPPDHDPDVPVGLDPERRAGLLTQASVMAVHAHASVTSPVHRGLLVLEQVLCRDVRSPPDDVSIAPIEPDPGDPRTRRERFAAHVADPTCATCHTAIDPLGFAFEHYDALGAYRADDVDDGVPVDAATVVSTGTDVDGPVANGVELARRLAVSADVRACVVQQAFRFALGRPIVPDDGPQLDWLERRFEASDGDLPGLWSDLVTTDAFRFRHRVDPEGP